MRNVCHHWDSPCNVCWTTPRVLVLMLSPIPAISDFGVVSSIAVAFSLILSLIVLPVLLAAEVRTSN